MCGIAGWIQLSDNPSSQFPDYFTLVCERIHARGPDCFGIDGVLPNGRISRGVTAQGDIISKSIAPAIMSMHDRGVRGALVNFRGIPTTEDRGRGGEQAVQPYVDDLNVPMMTVVHNGQLSNDEELYARHHLPLLMKGVDKDIDTYAFISMMYYHKTMIGNTAEPEWDTPWEAVIDGMRGSWAVALYDQEPDRFGNQWFFARNFLGLTFAIWEEGDAKYLVWSSENDGLLPGLESRTQRVMTWEMPMDRSLALSNTDLITSADESPMSIFWRISYLSKSHSTRSVHNSDSVAVVLSGGLDSTVCAKLACMDDRHIPDAEYDFHNIHLLHFHYGARAQTRETECVYEIHRRLKREHPDKNIKLTFIDLDFIRQLGGSTLTDPDAEIAEGELGMETAHEWVPARNLAMIGLAAAYCDRHDIGTIMLGLNREESGTYRDNSSEFFKSMNSPLGLGTQSQPTMVMPVGNMMKHHIAKKGLEIGAPLDVSWSCYHGDETRCGRCGPCTLRQRAFSMNGVRDPVEYVQLDEVAEQMLKEKDAA